VELSQGLPEQVLGDPLRLRQVWLNLLGNAVKFTARGRVAARLQNVTREGGAWLAAQVVDTGIGIAPEAQSRIFQPFVQADNDTTRHFGGTGLGLVITRKLVELMGGRIDLHSEPGRGTTFSFEWPVEVLQVLPTKEPAPGPHKAAPEPQGPGLRILVADDHPVNRQLALAQLKALGQAQVTMAHDGEEALEQLRHARFDVVFMDVQMPRLDGLQTTRALRGMPLPEQPWVVAMTANAYEEDRLACLQAGMNGFLAKPVNMAGLQQALQQAAQARETRTAGT